MPSRPRWGHAAIAGFEPRGCNEDPRRCAPPPIDDPVPEPPQQLQTLEPVTVVGRRPRGASASALVLPYRGAVPAGNATSWTRVLSGTVRLTRAIASLPLFLLVGPSDLGRGTLYPSIIAPDEDQGDSASRALEADAAGTPPPDGDNDDRDKDRNKKIRSLEQRLKEHKEKLAEYKANPERFDNKGFLQNAPTQDVRERIIQGRINHLESEIANFQRQINALKGIR